MASSPPAIRTGASVLIVDFAAEMSIVGWTIPVARAQRSAPSSELQCEAGNVENTCKAARPLRWRCPDIRRTLPQADEADERDGEQQHPSALAWLKTRLTSGWSPPHAACEARAFRAKHHVTPTRHHDIAGGSDTRQRGRADVRDEVRSTRGRRSERSSPPYGGAMRIRCPPMLPVVRSRNAYSSFRFYSALRTSVRAKSFPTNSNGQENCFASTYAKQSPKLSPAGWKLLPHFL